MRHSLIVLTIVFALSACAMGPWSPAPSRTTIEKTKFDKDSGKPIEKIEIDTRGGGTESNVNAEITAEGAVGTGAASVSDLHNAIESLREKAWIYIALGLGIWIARALLAAMPAAAAVAGLLNTMLTDTLAAASLMFGAAFYFAGDYISGLLASSPHLLACGVLISIAVPGGISNAIRKTMAEKKRIKEAIKTPTQET